MDLSLEHRLLRFLDREEASEARYLLELRALAIDERVLEGECIAGAEFLAQRGDTYEFEVRENLSKFRSGDPMVASDGIEFEAGSPLSYGSFDAANHRLFLEVDRFLREEPPELVVGTKYCLDRRSLGLSGRLHDSVRAAFASDSLRAQLEGQATLSEDGGRAQRARARLIERGMNAAQVAAGTAVIAAESLALVQGPPGTGKTRLMAEVLALLARAGCRIVVSAFTNRAVDNVLLALRAAAPDVPTYKLGFRSSVDPAVLAAGVLIANPKRPNIPDTNCVVAGTCFQLIKLPPALRFHYAIFDEAGQMPIPHAIVGMLLARRCAFFGDHRQLPPVITERHADQAVTRSVFEHLDAYYGSHLLDVTYRMNTSVCRVVSDAFYGGALHSADSAAQRRMPFVAGGGYDAVLDPELGVVIARVDHLQPGMRSEQEAKLVADLACECVRRHGVAAREIAIVAPFRAQVRLIRSALQRLGLSDEALVVDTVERIQGQERDVILVSLACGDPDSLAQRSQFFFSPNRLNVALSRARTKAILVASRAVFEALPMDPESLRAAALFRKIAASVPQIDLTAIYGGVLSDRAGPTAALEID